MVLLGDLLSIARAFLRSLPLPNFSDAEVRMAYLILVATAPAALIGYLFEDFFATEIRSRWVVIFNLVFVGALFLVAESVGRKTESASKLGPAGALGVGLAQAAALVPGVSRSGATITCGWFLGLRREEAARFSFLMSVPVTAAAPSLSLAEAAGEAWTPTRPSCSWRGRAPRRRWATSPSGSCCVSWRTTPCGFSPTTASHSQRWWPSCS